MDESNLNKEYSSLRRIVSGLAVAGFVAAMPLVSGCYTTDAGPNTHTIRYEPSFTEQVRGITRDLEFMKRQGMFDSWQK